LVLQGNAAAKTALKEAGHHGSFWRGGNIKVVVRVTFNGRVRENQTKPHSFDLLGKVLLT
jgi:hypothetical protein